MATISIALFRKFTGCPFAADAATCEVKRNARWRERDLRFVLRSVHTNLQRDATAEGARAGERDALYRKREPPQIDLSPLAKTPRELVKLAKWVKPVSVAELNYSEFTPDDSLRHPSFQGLREDKDATAVILEKPMDGPSDRKLQTGGSFATNSIACWRLITVRSR